MQVQIDIVKSMLKSLKMFHLEDINETLTSYDYYTQYDISNWIVGPSSINYSDARKEVNGIFTIIHPIHT